MLMNDISPNGYTYSAMIEGCSRADQPESATLYLENMLLQLKDELHEQEKNMLKGVSERNNINNITLENLQVCFKKMNRCIGPRDTNDIIDKYQTTIDQLENTVHNIHPTDLQTDLQTNQGSISSKSIYGTTRNNDSTTNGILEIIRTNTLSASNIRYLTNENQFEMENQFNQLCMDGHTELAVELYTALEDSVQDDPLIPEAVKFQTKNILLHALCQANDMKRSTILFEQMTLNADRFDRFERPPPRSKGNAPSADEYFQSDKVSLDGGTRPLVKGQANAVTYTTMVRKPFFLFFFFVSFFFDLCCFFFFFFFLSFLRFVVYCIIYRIKTTVLLNVTVPFLCFKTWNV